MKNGNLDDICLGKWEILIHYWKIVPLDSDFLPCRCTPAILMAARCGYHFGTWAGVVWIQSSSARLFRKQLSGAEIR